MAPKTHVNNTVVERRLRPVYDSLDNGNNKKALHEAEKVLKKQRDNQCAKALKALALLRLGKKNECEVIMDQVCAETPSEDSTLQVISICYKEMHQPAKISEVYEAAVKAVPNNEELLTHLFMAYVRLEDYQKQKQTALTLYKLKPKNPYYFWAVMSVVMQGIRADDKQAKGITLSLAERMVLKLVQEGKLEAEQEVQLYLMILELQGKSEEMLNVLTGPLATHLSSVPQHKAALLLKLERFPEAAETYKELISKDVNNWAHYQGYLSAALKYQKPEECLNFFNDIISRNEKKVRAPYLGKLELLKRTRNEKASDICAESIKLMLEYFSKFGEKGCVVGDLRLYLTLLTPKERLDLLQTLDEDVGLKPEQFPTSVQQMQKHIHLEQLRRICGLHHPPHVGINEQKQLVKRLYELYNNGNELCPIQDRLPTDFCPADSYILLATHLLHQMWYDTCEASYLYGAMALLEGGLLHSPANFHIKILLVRTYLEAGFVVAADHVFKVLDVKHIQIDSLGYLHVPLLAPLGHPPHALTILDHTIKFFMANYYDSADHLTFAYKYGSFIKIEEFEELRERLKNSLHFVMSSVDKMLIELSWCNRPAILFAALSSMDIRLQESFIKWDSLRDNRDLDVVRGWEPLNEKEEDPRMREETRVCMLRLLGARALMLRMIGAAAKSDASFLFSQLATELKQLDAEKIPPALEKFEVDGRKDRPCPLLVPMDAVERLREAHYSGQLKTIANLAESLARTPYPDSDCIEALRNSPCLESLPLPEMDTPVSYKSFLLRASTCSESLAIISAICSLCADQARPRTSRKKNKKKITTEIQSLTLDDDEQKWKDIAVMLTEKVEDYCAALTKLEKYTLHTGLNREDDVHDTIVRLGKTSLKETCRALKHRAKNTIQLLSELQS